MSRFFFSIRFRLMVLVLLALVPALGLTFYTGLEQRRIAATQAKEEARRLARLVSSNQSQLVQGANHLLYTLAQLPQVRNHEPAPCSSLFASLINQYPWFINIGAATLEGDLFASALPYSQPVNLADRSYFHRALETGDFSIGNTRLAGSPRSLLSCLATLFSTEQER